MNKTNKHKILTAVWAGMLLAMPCLVFAQDPGGGPDAPIDGGLSVLLAAGAAYGVKKYRDHKKKAGDEEVK